MKHELSGMLFPWERSAFGDRTEPLKWWQKAYWVGFACAPCNPALRRAFAAHAPPRDRCVMSYWVAEKSYNKVTTGKWHGNEPRPKGAPKPKPKPTLVKSRVRLRNRAASMATHVPHWAPRCSRAERAPWVAADQRRNSRHKLCGRRRRPV